MPSPLNTPGFASATAVADLGATEVVVLTIPNVKVNFLQGQVVIDGILAITTAASGTADVVVKCREGTTTSGTQVGSSLTITATTSAKYIIPFLFDDSPGQVDGASYVITVTETSATADGTVAYVAASVFVSSLN